MSGSVYFLRQFQGCGPVKIGWSKDPTARLVHYNRISPYPLEIAALIAGPPSLELQFHAEFAASHSHHEWYGPSDELDAAIAAINAGQFDVSKLPAPKRNDPPGCIRTWTKSDVTGLDDTPLSRWMARFGVNDAELAAKLGVSRIQVLRIRRHTSRPSAALAAKIEKITGIDAWQLVSRGVSA